MMRGIVVAGRFLTRIPFPGRVVEGHELALGVPYYPLIGFLVGGLVAASIALSAEVLPPPVAVVIGLVTSTLLTGAFHEDALADTCDGLGGGATRERALEIMRDSRIGTYGAVGLALLYLARFASWGALSKEALVLMLPIAFALARASSAVLLAWLPHARAEGAARDVQAQVTARAAGAAVALAVVPGLVLVGAKTLWLVLASAVATLLLGLWFRRRIGGITGDTLGAANVLIEVLVVLLVLSSTSERSMAGAG
jgi:adenosylcobinamide-GDP ribazoletransferase